MATANKFEGWVGYLGTKAIDLNADTINAYLTNTAPSASLDDVKADLAEIATGNGYTGPVDTANTAAEASGTLTVTATDITITASGGAIAQFRYVAHFDDTVATPVVDPLSHWHDYGSALDLADGESFTIDYTSLATLA